MISSSRYIPAPFTLKELLAKKLPTVRWAVPSMLPEGVILLAGKPKQGKSWLALDLAFAIAAGGAVLGKIPVEQGGVLYLALEDNERRLQARAKQLLASMGAVPAGIVFEVQWPRLDQGGLTHIEAYLKAHSEVRLVVVDTWAKVSPRLQGSMRSQYEDDYQSLAPLKRVADTYRVSVLVIHHLRKMRADDPLDEVTGSIGMVGAVDSILILKRERGQQEATLYVTGRDIEQELRLALTFDQTTATWRLVGDRTDIARTKERQDILDLLTEQAPLGMSPRQVAEALQKNYHTVRSLLRKMEDAHEVQHDHNRYFATPKNLLLERAEQSRSRLTDDSDYGDDTTDHSVSMPSQVRQYAPLRRDADVQATPADHLMDAEDWQQVGNHQHRTTISVINRNHGHQPSFEGQRKPV